MRQYVYTNISKSKWITTNIRRIEEKKFIQEKLTYYNKYKIRFIIQIITHNKKKGKRDDLQMNKLQFASSSSKILI